MLEKRFWISMAAACLIAVPVAAQEEGWEGVDVQVPELVTAAASPNCGLGVVYDNGGFESGYSIGPGDAGSVMRFDLPAGTTALDQVCTCFSRAASAPSSMGFEVVVYDNNGAGGGPGTFLGSVDATASSIPVFPATQFYNVNLAGSGITLPDQNVFVGVVWPGGSPPIYICGDNSGSTPQRVLYGSGNGGASWTGYGALFPTNPARALGIRVDPLTGGTCVPSATAMCLNDNRFKVEATFRTAASPTEAAKAVKLTDDTGYLWFFASTNVEVVVKVLNGCGLNSHYWIFAAGLTNVEVVLSVTDTQTGSQRTYVNPLNQAFPPLQDTSGLATCP